MPKQKKRRKKRSLFSKIVPYIGILIGLCMLGYFPVSEMIDTQRREAMIADLDKGVNEDSFAAKKAELLAQAHAYNARIAALPPSITASDIWPYERQLATGAEGGAFSAVIIPSIRLNMPIWHGTSESVLSAGVGHLENTSLPVGGQSSHCVISAHSGAQNTRAFDDIRNLKEGDVFALKTLGDLYAYEVYDIEVVWPYEMDSLLISPGEDLCTLVTCTPYGVNDHRLLVHGKRVPVPADFYEQAPTVKDIVTNRRVWPFALGFLAVLVLLIWLVITSIRRKKKRKAKTDPSSDLSKTS